MRMYSRTAMLAAAALASTCSFARFDGDLDKKLVEFDKEIKGFGEDVKGLKGSMEKDLADLRKLIDETKTAVDPLVKKQVEEMAASVAVKHDALEKSTKSVQEQLDKLETAFKRAPNGPAGDDEKKAIERAISYWEMKGALQGTLKFGTPLTPETIDRDGYALWEKSFGLYLRSNDERAVDQKALSVGLNPDGGYLVPTARSARIIAKIYETSPMRSLATIETIGTSELELPIDTDEGSVGWVGETETRSTTNTPQVGVQKIPVHELYAKPKATQKLLEDASINIEAWLADKIADKMGRTEATAFISGNGVGRPRGILGYTFTTTVASVTRGTPLAMVSGAATALTADAIVSLPFMLKSAYLGGASWLMKRSSVMAAMLLKDGQGQYLWRPSFTVGGPSVLGGYEVHMADDMPAIAASAYSVAFGNWKQAYTIVDRLGITTLRDPFSAKPFVEFYSRKRVGGDVTDFEAFVAMQISA